MRWHLGEPIIPREWVGVAYPGCGDSLDAFGDRTVCCAKGAGGPATSQSKTTSFKTVAPRVYLAREKQVDPTSLHRPADLGGGPR